MGQLVFRFRRYFGAHGLLNTLGMAFARGVGMVISVRQFDVLERPLPVAPMGVPVELKRLGLDEEGWFSRLSLWRLETITTFRTRDKVCYTAWLDDKCVGYIWAKRGGLHLIEGLAARAVDVAVYHGPEYVFPQYRGRGIHSSMVDAMTALSHAEGCERSVCTVVRSNQTSMRGLKRSGYKTVQSLFGVRLFRTFSVFLAKLDGAKTLQWSRQVQLSARWSLVYGFREHKRLGVTSQ